ncbi:MAG: helix-turn-helix domain-containing protein [Methanobacteriota archaeon]
MDDSLQSTTCPIRVSLLIIGGKWKPLILWHLKDGPQRFTHIQRSIPRITQMMLTKQLRELESDKIIERTMYHEIPPRVDYRLTDIGRSVFPVLCALYKWGKTYQEDVSGVTDYPCADLVSSNGDSFCS